jgi:hypothetical protein
MAKSKKIAEKKDHVNASDKLFFQGKFGKSNAFEAGKLLAAIGEKFKPV